METYELKLELGVSNSSGDCVDWDVLALVNVEQLECGCFSVEVDTFIDWDIRHLDYQLNKKWAALMPKHIADMMHKEAKIKFLELKKEKEVSNEQY